MRDEQTEQLIQQYEEVALGLLMEEYTKAEGERLLQEFETASAKGEIEPMPEDLKTRYHRLIDQAYQKKRRRKLFSCIAKTVGKVAVVALALLGIATTAILSVDAWRVPVLNFVLDKSGDYAEVSVGYSDSSLKEQYEAILETVCSNVPLDYTLMEKPNAEGLSLVINMRNSEGKLIRVCVRRGSSQITMDTEDAQIEEVNWNGTSAYLIKKNGIKVVWYDAAKGLIISAYAEDLPLDALYSLAYALTE